MNVIDWIKNNYLISDSMFEKWSPVSGGSVDEYLQYIEEMKLSTYLEF